MDVRTGMVGASVIAGIALFIACGGTASDPVPLDAGAASSTSSSGTSSSTSSGSTSTSSASSGSPDDAGPDAATPSDAGPNDPDCLPAYGDSPAHCKVGLECRYPQGRCSCLGYCGGPPPPPDVDFSRWSCTSPQDNGCPFDKPTEGAACTIPNKMCSYGDCCTQTFTCKKDAGGWKSGPLLCPP